MKRELTPKDEGHGRLPIASIDVVEFRRGETTDAFSDEAKTVEKQSIRLIEARDTSRLCVSTMELYGWLSMSLPIVGSISAAASLLAAWIMS